MKTLEFDANNYSHVSAAISIWNRAYGDDLRITPRFLEYNLRTPRGVVQHGRLAMEHEQPVGFVLASALCDDPQTSPPDIGWIDALAVAPNAQRRGIGSMLLDRAEDWLRANDCTCFRLGGGLHPFFPGYPLELGNAAFFQTRGYVERAGSREVWDVARDLSNYRGAICQIAQHIRPAQFGEEDALLKFFTREFPNRWRFEFEEFLRARGRMSDYLILLTERGVDGFARLTFEDSERPIERFYMHPLPRRWGQLGPIGVSTEMRGKGLGSALLDAALCHLRDKGVRGCVIDWTDQVDFYAYFGFIPYRGCKMLVKSMAA